MKTKTASLQQTGPAGLNERENAFVVLDLVSRGLFDEAEKLLARTGFARALAAADTAQALAARLALKPEQFGILAAVGRCGASKAMEPVHLAARGELELLSGRPVKAIEALNASLRMAPGNIGTLLLLGRAFLAIGQHAEATSNLDRALSLAPHDGRLQTEVGQLHVKLGNVDRAIGCFQAAISIEGKNFTALFALANLFKSINRLPEAVGAYTAALKLAPRHVEALNNRGATLQVMDRDADALRDFDLATRTDPRHLFAWMNKGVSLFKLDRFEESLKALEVAFAIDPAMPDVFHNCGLTLAKLDRHEEAMACFEAATLIAPERLQGLLSKGNALVELHRYAEAVEVFRSAIERDRTFTDAHINMAGALQELGRHRDALDIMDEALAVRPGYSEAYWNKSNSMLPFGPSEEAWKAYEHRLHISVGDPLPDFGLPLLGDGSPEGKRLLVQWEQRFGDIIQMLRFVPALSSVCDCHWQLTDSMADMVRASFPDIKICGRDQCPPGIDARTPYTSLPLNLRVFSVEDIPADIPYLKSSAAAQKKWRTKAKSLGRRVGIVWRGNPKPPGRSVPIDRMLPIFENFSGDLVSLQMDVTPDEAEVLKRYSVPDVGVELKTFDDSAGLVSQLDLVITIDTAVAHLAGALGRKTWVLLKYGADWRWMLERSDSPWYPTAKLFRQPSVGDWDSVIEQISADLAALQEG